MADAGKNGDGGGIGAISRILDAKHLVLLRKSDRFVILAVGLVVICALGAIAMAPGDTTVVLVLSLASMVVVAGLVGLVQIRSLTHGDKEAEMQIQVDAVRAANGEWWQLVPADDHPGLAYITISLSEISERHAIQGITFDENGNHRARFSSDTVAVRTAVPIEIYYLWRGTVIDKATVSSVSGLGRIRFDSVGNEKRPMAAEGMFTRGTPTDWDFGKPRVVEMYRLSKEESTALREDPSCLPALAVAAFKRYKLEPGRVLSEAGGRG